MRAENINRIVVMNIGFYLKDKSGETSPVRVVITHRGKVYRRAIGITANVKSWKKQKTGNVLLDQAIKRIRIGLEESLNELSTGDEILEALDRVLEGQARNVRKDTPSKLKTTPSLWEYFEEWSERECASIKQNRTAYRNIKRMMGTSEDWEDIDSSYYYRLVQKMDREEMSKNYQGTIINKLKMMMSEASKLKYHHNEEFRTFHRFHTDSDTVYLTQEELDRVCNYRTNDEMEAKARDMFILGVYTASRFSDYSRLSADMIENGKLRFIQKKTHESVVLPVSPRVIEVLKRNGGHAPDIGQVVFNRMIKVVCMKCGLMSTILVNRSRGKKNIQEKVHKYQLVSSHTARRTGATLLYLNKVPIRQCMMLTGHTTEACFRKYIRVTKEENASMLSDIEFFK